ncbi:PsiF family protein [Chitiniphilus eburneus]|uniref:Phosphate starvation-inducible protein n=1 Tax=Chitiniphilus eburneus TaxID=2571148 RepID=A0A4U0PZN7_9NEIS|nr:PsiF family protein [Chitiniphilus eburneus]TJZ74059.1 phosphate starvation-inducible protein [Chitiniphilus eburneus]
MKSISALLALVAGLTLASGAQAATDQQNKMATCNKEASAKSLKGDERKKFMSECLKKDSAAKPTSQQDKMGYCNKEASAKSLKGDERKKFMSDCLKKK